MIWRDLFEDSDMVGQSEYTAIVDTITLALFGFDEWLIGPEQKITADNRDRIRGILQEFRDWATALLDRLDNLSER